MSSLLKLRHRSLPLISQNCCTPTVGICRDPFSIVKSFSWKLRFIRAQGNQSQTARLLGITPRSVYNMVRKYNLHL